MSQKYRFKSLQLLEEEKETTKPSATRLDVFEVGETKTIDFILLNGTRQNFAYSHYITSWLGKEDDERIIKIFFATHLVTIKGYCLDQIYDELNKFNVKSVTSNDVRYVSMLEEDQAFVTQIDIVWKNEKNQS